MAILGGSPLGLIGVKSGPTADGMSTFNGGKSRNVNVNLYNSGKEGNKEKLDKSKQSTKGGAFSLFTGGNFIKSWANIKPVGTNEKLRIGGDDSYTGVSRSTLHNNDIYDTSILNIVEKTSGTAAALRPADFAYLKNVGVYPNNRLVIARRFASPAPDDIYGFKSQPMSVLITWKKTDEDFLDISFGEEWTDSEADFKNLLNKLSEDLLGKKAGGTLAGGLGAIPLPGWSEALQRTVMESLGVQEKDSYKRRLPAGDPNLIKIAKKRKTIPYGEAGSGLTCTVSIKMICEYEQKFISGIDPTLVWMDIIANILRFGTSPGVDYGVTTAFGETLKKWVSDPKTLITDMAEKLGEAIKVAKDEVLSLLDDKVKDASDTSKDKKTDKQLAKEEKSSASKALDKLVESLGDSLAKTIGKYEEDVKGIANALTRSPSTPWHVTIGNPLRPSFCSGDMLTTTVQLILGPTLAFNDLPSSIRAEFTLTNARPWGLDEIQAKFNTGNLRTVNVLNDGANLPPGTSLLDGSYKYNKLNNSSTDISNLNGPNNPAGGNVNASTNSNGATSSSAPSKDGQDSIKVSKDPNSKDPVVQENKPNSPTGDGSSTEKSGTNLESKIQQTNKVSDVAVDGNSTSKLGYTYTYQERRNEHRFVVYKGSDVKLEGKYYSKDEFTKEELMINTKISVGDI